MYTIHGLVELNVNNIHNEMLCSMYNIMYTYVRVLYFNAEIRQTRTSLYHNKLAMLLALKVTSEQSVSCSAEVKT
jgi:hypothetical protein